MYDNLKDINILYVEDDEFIREQTSTLLSVVFNTIHTAVDGQDGIEKFNLLKDEIHVIVTDINMPKVSGIEMSKSIKNNLDRTIPIVAISAYSQEDHIMQDIADLFTFYLRKPTQIKDLIKSIEDAYELTR